MLVKLHDYNNNGKINREDAYKAPNGFYYSSEDAYKATIQREEQRKQCIDKMYDFMGYQSFMKIPTIFYKKLQTWETYGYNVVLTAMKLSEDSIRQADMTKEFSSEFNKISYFSAIIQNHLNDAFKMEKRKAEVKADAPKIETDNIDNIGHKAKVNTSVADLLGGI